MKRHRKYGLLNEIVQAINQNGWNVLYVADTKYHPFLIRMYKNRKNYLLRVYIWSLTHGGGSKRPKDEYRIQITGIQQFIQNKNEITLILGWWEKVGVFAGFDFNHHKGNLGKSPSIQIREENLRKAHINGLSPCNRGNNEITIAFRPDFFIEYVKNIDTLHRFGESTKDLQVLEKVADNQVQVNKTLLSKVKVNRRIVVSQIARKMRDSSFRARILTAYGGECAFCGLQLKLIDAAHILPASIEKSSDETSNGIALCALHHRAYDHSLVTFNEKYQILTNSKKITELRRIGHDGGLINFLDNLKPMIKVPPSVNDRPNINYIQMANQFRGWD